jgi:SAM-dependent methyltransferase
MFTAADLAQLDSATLRMLFGDDPAAPQVEDAAIALGTEPEHLQLIASALPPQVAGALVLLGRHSVTASNRERSAQRLVRGAFWYLLYQLAPEIWDRVATSEHVAPDLLRDLPCRPSDRAVEVGAGSGRLTAVLEQRVGQLIAVEPSSTLRRFLRHRLPLVPVVAGVGQYLPLRSACADVIISCATFDAAPPDSGDLVRAELERCVRPGGMVALIAANDTSWWEAQGYTLTIYPPSDVKFEPELESIVGPPIPPHKLLVKRIRRVNMRC